MVYMFETTFKLKMKLKTVLFPADSDMAHIRRNILVLTKRKIVAV